MFIFKMYTHIDKHVHIFLICLFDNRDGIIVQDFLYINIHNIILYID
jgi:hypothetical protein